MKEMDERLSITMNFYCIMGTAAYFGKPEMFPFVATRTVQLTMEYGLCKHSISGFVQFAAMLCSNKEEKKGIESASQIGRAAMSCSKKRYNTPDQLPYLYLVYYIVLLLITLNLYKCVLTCFGKDLMLACHLVSWVLLSSIQVFISILH
jgi:hypothetical protein